MILIESARVSPFLALVLPPSAKPMTLPPSRCTAVSNDSRVRVDGSKKQLPTSLSFSRSLRGCCFSLPAVATTSSSSSRLKSGMEMMCLR